MTGTHRLTIAGLGPGDAALLTVEARAALAAAPEVWLRTARHPAVAGLPEGPHYRSFDELYERGASFDEVYESIVARVLEAATTAGTVYAVPGHPLFGEATVRALLERAAAAGVATLVIPGISFLDVLAPLLRLDPLADGLLVLDALSFAAHRRLLAPARPTVIAQVYDRRAASQVKLALLEQYPAEHVVRIVRGAGTHDAGIIETALAALDHADVFDHLTSLYVPPLALTEDVRSFEGLRAVVARLRSPDGGCPWDLEQTHETLKRFLLEEAYEALDALDTADPHRLAEELGDLLMQVVLHAQVAEDAGAFTIEDVFGGITEKLVRRHPHVFGDVSVEDASDVVRNWERLKKGERPGAGVLDAVPLALPALAQAQSVLSRAAGAGIGAEVSGGPAPGEALARLAAGGLTAEGLGDLLFAIVSLARERGVDAEESLRLAVRRFRARVAEAEAGER
ncbi:MAG TPA: MazG family protein [Dehalococcoidia bacterium]|nr:MazG family protein [Dehalococcoidia bacterium]